jgi:hypothetical protein
VKLILENWREYLNEDLLSEKLMLKPGPQGWDLYAKLVGEAYMAAPDHDARAEAGYAALKEFLDSFIERIAGVVKVEYVDYHPYRSSKEMMRRVKDEGVMLVSTADAEHPILDPVTNAKFRAFHDFGGHIQREQAFSLKGEISSYNIHVRMVPDAAVPVLFSEVIGQVCCFYLNNKTNCPQKAVVLDGFDFVNIGVVDGYNIINKELIKSET